MNIHITEVEEVETDDGVLRIEIWSDDVVTATLI